MTLNTSPAAERNRPFILEVLEQHLPRDGTVLEIASGTGQHAVHFAPALAPRLWQPSDRDTEALASISAWRQAQPSSNLAEPLLLDVLTHPWPVEGTEQTPAITAVVAINMVHIAPWRCCEALLDGAARILSTGGVLYLYGPFLQQDQPTAPSNQAFDLDLKRRNPEWGIRGLEQVTQAAGERGLDRTAVVAMPANNLSVVFTRR